MNKTVKRTEVHVDSPWGIAKLDADDKANDMHETVVEEMTQKLKAGQPVWRTGIMQEKEKIREGLTKYLEAIEDVKNAERESKRATKQETACRKDLVRRIRAAGGNPIVYQGQRYSISLDTMSCGGEGTLKIEVCNDCIIED